MQFFGEFRLIHALFSAQFPNQLTDIFLIHAHHLVTMITHNIVFRNLRSVEIPLTVHQGDFLILFLIADKDLQRLCHIRYGQKFQIRQRFQIPGTVGRNHALRKTKSLHLRQALLQMADTADLA